MRQALPSLLRLRIITAFAIVFASGPLASARDWTAEKEGDPVVAVHVDVGAFANSEVGQLLLEAGTKIAAGEMEKDPDEVMDAVIKSLGFNPFEQDAKLTARISDLEEPLDGLQLTLQLKNTTGNLEGFLLAAPGYRSGKHGDQTIHTVDLDGEEVSIGFHTSGSGTKRIVAASSHEIVTDAMDALEKPNASADNEWKMPDNQFIHVQLMSLPEELSEEPPISGIAQLLRESSLSLGEIDEDLQFKITLVAKEKEKAVQLQQLAQGVVAMASLFKEEIREELDDEGAESVLGILDQITIDREGTKVTVQSRIPRDTMIRFLREEADLPL